MKRRKKRHIRAHRTLTLPGPAILAGVFLFLLASVSGKYALPATISKVHPLPELHHPMHLFSGPLIMTFGQTQILGADTFDPEDIVTYVNIERSALGIPPLRSNRQLAEAAKRRLDTIMKHQHFSHQDPYDHIELGTVLPQVGYQYRFASENIGMGGSSGSDFVYGFMHSASHRDNLLNRELVDTGVAVASGPYGPWYVTVVVQLFAVPGGKEEFLGYSDTDRESYGRRLKRVNSDLNPIVWTIQRLSGNPHYTDERFDSLVRERQILVRIVSKMRQEKPLDANDVALVRSFNFSL
jgi:uncharacterized protein YkwD